MDGMPLRKKVKCASTFIADGSRVCLVSSRLSLFSPCIFYPVFVASRVFQRCLINLFFFLAFHTITDRTARAILLNKNFGRKLESHESAKQNGNLLTVW